MSAMKRCVFKYGGSRYNGRYVGFILKKREKISYGRICALAVCLKGLTGGCGAA